jgi:hypothetical protein
VRGDADGAGRADRGRVVGGGVGGVAVGGGRVAVGRADAEPAAGARAGDPPAGAAGGPGAPPAAWSRGAVIIPRPGRGRDGWERDDRRGPGWAETFAIAWPAYRRPASWPRALGLVVDAPALGAAAAPGGAAADGPAAGAAAAGAAAEPVVRGDLSAAAAGDFKRDRGNVLARLVTRAAVRAALVREAGRAHKGLDDVVRVLTNATEHADTRSWHLLPGEVQVLRVRLPAGAHALAVDVGGRRVPLGTVRVAPGGVRFVSARVWDPAGLRVTAFGTEGGPAEAGRVTRLADGR